VRTILGIKGSFRAAALLQPSQKLQNTRS